MLSVPTRSLPRRPAVAAVRLSLAGALLSFLSSRPAQADPISIEQRRTDAYYVTHGVIAGGGFALTGAAALALAHHGPGSTWGSFPPDDVVRLNFSESAATISDRLLLATTLLPVLVQMSDGFDTAMGNATLVYAEAHAATLLLTTATKLIVRRPRPYTHSPTARVEEFEANAGSDAYRSFFSGHASTAFTAATSGAILYSARTDELWARHSVWGVEFLLAGITAQLRVRAGRHYRTDIWTGTLVGFGVGLSVPLLNRVDIGRVRASEWGTAAGAGALTMVLSEVVSFCDLLNLMGACELPRDVRLPAVPRTDTETGASLFLLPAVVPGGAGVAFVGQL